MKKILFLIHTLGVGGAEKVLVNLVNNMDASQYDITVMTVINTGAFIEKLNPNIKYKYMFSLPKILKKEKSQNKDSGSLLNKESMLKNILSKIYQFIWRYMPCQKIYQKFIKEKYDYEVAFLEGIPAKIIAESTNLKAVKISWIHVDLINETKSEKFFKNLEEEKNTYQKFNHIVAVSEIVKQQFSKKFSFDSQKIMIKYNPIDDKEIKRKAQEGIEEQKQRKEFLMCTVGRLSKQKGYDRLVRVAKRLADDKLSFQLWIIGVGPDDETLKKYVQENLLEDRIVFLGYQENPYKYIKQADLFVCSSRAEGYSTAVSEACILGIPIVTTNCSGMKEILGTENQFGKIVENKEEDLYKGIYEIITNPKLYEQYKNNMTKQSAYIKSLSESVRNIEEIFNQ